MTLPYDTARCHGVYAEGQWREGCEDCQRRTSPGRPDGLQTYTEPPKIIVFECENRVPPKEQAFKALVALLEKKE